METSERARRAGTPAPALLRSHGAESQDIFPAARVIMQRETATNTRAAIAKPHEHEQRQQQQQQLWSDSCGQAGERKQTARRRPGSASRDPERWLPAGLRAAWSAKCRTDSIEIRAQLHRRGQSLRAFADGPTEDDGREADMDAQLKDILRYPTTIPPLKAQR
jgi:hypothetical protein